MKIKVMGYAPEYGTEGSAGADLKAAQDYVILPRQVIKVRAGLRVALPAGTFGMVCPRSGMALNFAVTVANAPGIIDSDYRGEVCVALINHGTEPFKIKKGQRIAQLVIVPCVIPQFVEADLDETDRGEGGFGSTGQ